MRLTIQSQYVFRGTAALPARFVRVETQHHFECFTMHVFVEDHGA
jgi:hypothetical protein